MDKDIVPGLLELIEKEFDEKTFNSDVLKKAIKALSDKNATYKDANLFAIEIGEILSDVLKTHIRLDILPDGKMHFNIADRILNATIKKNYELIIGYTSDVQTELNHIAGLNIKGQAPKINQHKIDGIIERLSAEEFEKIKWLLDEPIKNLSQSMVDDTARANMAFQHKSGLSPKITRVVVGNCCDWCREIAGTYNYKDSPPNIYQRHRYCRCMVVYDPGDGKAQNIYTKKWEDPEKREKIEERKVIGLETNKEKTTKVFEKNEKELPEETESTKVEVDTQKDKLKKTETKLQRMQRELEESKAQTQAMKQELVEAYMEKRDMTLEEATKEADKVEARAREKHRNRRRKN